MAGGEIDLLRRVLWPRHLPRARESEQPRRAPGLGLHGAMQDDVLFSIETRGEGATTYVGSPLEVAGFAANFPRIERSTTTEEP
jgi:hypothetical protein